MKHEDSLPAVEFYAQVILGFDFMNSKPSKQGSSAAAISLDHTIYVMQSGYVFETVLEPPPHR